MAIAEFMASGNGVTLIPVHGELTTQHVVTLLSTLIKNCGVSKNGRVRIMYMHSSYS